MRTRQWLPKFAWALPVLWSCEPSEGEALNQHQEQEPDITATEASDASEEGSSSESSSESSDGDSLGESSDSDAAVPTPAPTSDSCSLSDGTADAASSFPVRPTPLNCDQHYDGLPKPTHAAVDRYSCFDAELPDYERIYRIEPQFDGPLSGFIDPTPGVDVVLLLLDEDCNPSACLSAVAIEDYGDWVMNDYELEAGKRYHLVVEGGSSSQAAVYALSVNCE